MILFIRNGQAASTSNSSDFSNLFDIADIADISELNSSSSGIDPETESGFVVKTNPAKRKTKFKSSKSSRFSKSSKPKETAQTKISRFTEYLSGRKYYILALSFVYVVGLILGAVLVKNLDAKEAFDLSSSIDLYFSQIPAMDMTARIFGNIAVSLAFLAGIYLCGATVFASALCALFSLYKGLSSGFIIGVYIIGGSTVFHAGVCAVHFVLGLLMMVIFILACGESMRFSSFLFKSEDSFKNNLSFKNISVYTSRFILFLILISMAAIIQTVAVPIVYAVWG